MEKHMILHFVTILVIGTVQSQQEAVLKIYPPYESFANAIEELNHRVDIARNVLYEFNLQMEQDSDSRYTSTSPWKFLKVIIDKVEEMNTTHYKNLRNGEVWKLFDMEYVIESENKNYYYEFVRYTEKAIKLSTSIAQQISQLYPIKNADLKKIISANDASKKSQIFADFSKNNQSGIKTLKTKKFDNLIESPVNEFERIYAQEVIKYPEHSYFDYYLDANSLYDHKATLASIDSLLDYVAQTKYSLNALSDILDKQNKQNFIASSIKKLQGEQIELNGLDSKDIPNLLVNFAELKKDLEEFRTLLITIQNNKTSAEESLVKRTEELKKASLEPSEELTRHLRLWINNLEDYAEILQIQSEKLLISKPKTKTTLDNNLTQDEDDLTEVTIRKYLSRYMSRLSKNITNALTASKHETFGTRVTSWFNIYSALYKALLDSRHEELAPDMFSSMVSIDKFTLSIKQTSNDMTQPFEIPGIPCKVFGANILPESHFKFKNILSVNSRDSSSSSLMSKVYAPFAEGQFLSGSIKTRFEVEINSEAANHLVVGHHELRAEYCEIGLVRSDQAVISLHTALYPISKDRLLI